jgi:HAD superfamily hydrolase (TIGR01509 family)
VPTHHLSLAELAPPSAVLLDIDGTLVDSNYLQVQAWWEAFVAVGHPVPAWRVHRAIGRDSAQLLSVLLGDDDDRVGERAADEHDRRYAAMADRLRPLPGAREFVAGLASAGVKVVLATSAPSSELERLRATLDVEGHLHAVTGADDAENAKPSPELVQVAVQRSGEPVDRCVFVGDAVWDVEAAARAGVPCLGVRSGGIAPAELLDAGAIAVYDDVAHLHRAVTGDTDRWLAAPDDSR